MLTYAAFALTRHTVDPGADWCRFSQAAQRRLQRREASRSEHARAEAMPSESDYMMRFRKAEQSVCRAMAALDPDAVNVALVTELVIWFQRCGGLAGALQAVGAVGANSCDNRGEAVLVFLPGTKEIEDVKEALLRTELGRDAEQREWVLALHGGLAAEEQKRVFLRPPRGVFKVVLATNVAETSITIDDVGFVIDTGRVKEERYDAERRMGSLEDVLVSRAAAKQRRGRAGRVQAGLCIHLYASDVKQAAYTEPEVRRVALEQLVMRTKALRLRSLGGHRAADICSRLPEPPDREAVDGAVMVLTALGAFTADEELTELGKLLAKLPVDARLGKLILLGQCFGALDECLTIAAALASRSPFMSPMERREQADESKRKFCMGQQSDHLAVLSAYQQFDGMDAGRYEFARDRFLSIRTLQGIASLKRQLLEALSQAGLCASGLRASYVESLGRRAGNSDGVAVAIGARGPAHPLLLYAILTAALFPQVAYLHAPPTKKGPCSADQIRLHMREPKGTSYDPQV
jgi:ATP-dependent RNA helicase DHX57